ncbi:protein of unknown function [Methylorubrum extorquens]|uniref:Uncharacterized protein n=1 Tax=Methylorubrum extorquens TaxID=408 RepID=A0A2N9AL73_METEX|nr:protein of unknown function [Methylorubrum extorquens]
MRENPIYQLNTAFLADGALISVAPGAKPATPIHLRFVGTGEAAFSTATRVLVDVGAEAEFFLLESHEGPAGLTYQPNDALDVHIGAEAAFRHTRLNREGDAAVAPLDALGAPRRAGAARDRQPRHRRQALASPDLPARRGRGRQRGGQRRDAARPRPARGFDPARRPCGDGRRRPRDVQDGDRRRFHWRVPGQDHRPPGRAADRRQDEVRLPAPDRRRSDDEQAGAGNLRRRRRLRPWRHLRRAGRGSPVLPHGPRPAARHRREPAGPGLRRRGGGDGHA